MIAFLLPLLYILAFTGSLSFLLRKKFGYCLPLTVIFTAFLLFFSQFLFSTFSIGFYFCILFSCSFFLFLFLFRKDKNRIKNYFSKGFFAFLILYGMIYLLDYNRTFSTWDEFSHWGVMVKEMVRLDSFYSVDLSTLMVHKDYPPIIQLFELFWCKLLGNYNEVYVIKALHIFNFSMMIPIFEKSKSDKKIPFIVTTITSILIVYMSILLFDAHNVINTIYTDYTMSMLVVLGMFLIFTSKDIFSRMLLLLLASIGSTLLLTKQMGICLYLMILFFYFLSFFFHEVYKKKWTLKHTKHLICCIFTLIIIPFSLWIFWNHYIDSLGIIGQFELSDIDLKHLLSIAKNTYGEPFQNQAFWNFIHSLFGYNIVKGNLSLSYIPAVFLGLFLVYFSFKTCSKKTKYIKNGLLISLLLGAIGYAFVMLCLYVFCFGPSEGPSLASFNRYMPTYVIILILIAYFIYFVYTKKDYNLYILVFLCLILNTNTFTFLEPKIVRNVPDGYEWQGSYLDSKVEDNAKVFVIAQDSQGSYQFTLKYYGGAISTNLKHFSWPITEEEKENYECNFDDILEYMKEYDYLYFAQLDDAFIDEYQKVFTGDEIKVGNLYRFSIENQKINLKKVD